MMLSLDNLIEQALLEDIHTGDITTQALIPANSRASARLIAKEELILAGLFVAERVFKRLNAEVEFIPGLAEGARPRKAA